MGDFIPAGKLESTAKPTPDPDAPSAASGANNMSSPSEILFWYPNLIGTLAEESKRRERKSR